MAECSSSSSRPVKSILKRGNSEQRKTSQVEHPGEAGGIKWDEMNILMTEHPLDKDYGHMKIEEPKTPYNYDNPQGDDEDEQPGSSKMCPEALTDRVKEIAGQDCSGQRFFSRSSTSSDDDSDDELTPEQKSQKDEFKKWRKQHYNEFQNVRKARMLLAQEIDDDDDEMMDDKQSHVS